jgi:ppGpp synthetase/RelA/SpoT-type nucleotidyltranferase
MVTGRTKDVSSFQRKAIRKQAENPEKYADPLTAMGDKAGVRVVVDSLKRRSEVVGIAERVFDVGPIEDTSTRYRPNELGYLGLHMQARLRDTDLGTDDQALRSLEFELQIHTIAQHAWSTVSHPVTYKPLGAEPPPRLASQVFRLVALVSLFDEEVDRVSKTLMESPEYVPHQMLTVLDQQFAGWLPIPSDDQLSLQVLGVIAGAYSEADLSDFASRMDGFVREHRAELDVIFGEYVSAVDEYPLLFQPEVLAIFDRLLNAKAKLREAWLRSGIPVEYLEQVATVLAQPYT